MNKIRPYLNIDYSDGLNNGLSSYHHFMLDIIDDEWADELVEKLADMAQAFITEKTWHLEQEEKEES